MKELIIGRRDFVRLSLVGACFSLSGCQVNVNRPTLRAYQGLLPKELIKALPSPWRFKPLRNYQGEAPFKFQSTEPFDLLAIGDGWLQSLNMDRYAPSAINKDALSLNEQARLFLSNFESNIVKKIFPLGLSPWAMLFRNGKEWISKANESWQVLLEPGLKGQLILPKSPRLVMSLADQIGDEETLRRLRLQVKTYDDQNALNWLVSGRAKVAVMPLQNCISILAKDPRLTVAIPSEGAPLNWTILLQREGSQEAFPASLLQEICEMPLLSKLLSQGWIPSINDSDIMNKASSLKDIRTPFLSFLEKGLHNSWSLSPLDYISQKTLQERWLNSTP